MTTINNTTTYNRGVVFRPIDGNAFAILGAVEKAIKKANPGEAGRLFAEDYIATATSGDYNHLLAVSQDYVEFAL